MNQFFSKIGLLRAVKVFSCLLPLTSCLLFSSCSDDSYRSRLRELLIDDMTFDSRASSQQVTFRHEDLTNYDCQSSEDWCIVGFDVVTSTMKVSVTANTTYDPREATVTLADRLDSSAKRSFKVTQQRNTGLFVDKTDFEVPIEGGSVTVSLKSNVDYAVNIPADCDWLTLAPEQKTRGLDSTAFTLVAAGNTSYADRTALVTVTNKAEHLSGTVVVYQPFRLVFSADTTSFLMPMDEGTLTVNMASNVPYDIVIPDSCDWITTPAKTHSSPLTADTTAVVFSVKENKGYKDRSAVITLRNDDARAAVTVNVSQPFNPVFKPDQKTFDVPMEGGTVTVNMESNVSYEVVIPDGCDWVTLPDASSRKTRGTTTSAVVLKVAENNSYKDRSAVVVIQNKEAGVSQSITIRQPFNTTFSVDKNAFDVPMEGGTLTVNLTHNIGYEVKIPDGCDWITLPATSRGKTRGRARTRAAAETTAITLRVKENMSYADREAIVSIRNQEAGQEIRISVYQPFSTTFTPDNASFDVAMEGGTVTVNMTSNVTFDVNIPSDCDWITMPAAARGRTRAAKTTAVVFRVAENNSYKDREAVVTISNKEANVSVGIYFHQAFTPAFTVDKAEAEVAMEGGTVTATVESNVSYDVKIPSDCSWISQVSASRTRAAKKSVVMLKVEPNDTGRERNATIALGNDQAGVSATLRITQAFTPTFNVDASPLETDELGGRFGVSVVANVAVTVQSQADWLSVGKKTNVGDGYWTQEIVASPMTAKTAQRTGNVKFIHAAANESVVVAVTQNRTLFVSETAITLNEAGQTQALTLTNTASRIVGWTSTDTGVATVNSSGMVTAVANGSAVITVKSSDGKYSDSATVTVDIPEPPASEEPEASEDPATDDQPTEGSTRARRVRRR